MVDATGSRCWAGVAAAVALLLTGCAGAEGPTPGAGADRPRSTADTPPRETATASQPSSSASPGVIAFGVVRPTGGEVWLATPGGGPPVRVGPPAPGLAMYEPSLSPDGDWIAFVSPGEESASPLDTDVYVVRRDGTGLRQLTSSPEGDSGPTWSPDGSTIAFARARSADGRPPETSIATVPVTGGDVVELVRVDAPAPPVRTVASPTYAPDGRTLAFVRAEFEPDGTGTSRIVALDLATGDERTLVEDAYQPAFSPDGTRLAFASTHDRNGQTCFHDCRPSAEVYVARADGSAPIRLTDDPADDTAPAFSPDGRRLVFVSDRADPANHRSQLWLVDAVGGTPELVHATDGFASEPDWR